MKIIRKKVKWAKRRDGQNMWIEIHYSIKSSDLICTDLLDKKWMLKSYAGKKISQIMEKTTVDLTWVVFCIYQFLNLWIYLWWCQMFTLSDLRQLVGYFQVCGCLLQLLICSLYTQQSGLSTVGWGSISPGVRAFVSPQASCCSEWSVLPELVGCPFGRWLNIEIPAFTLSFLSPKLPSSVPPQESPAQSVPAFARAPGKWLQMKTCVLAL